MHAWSSVSCSCTEKVATRAWGTSKARAIIEVGVVWNDMTLPAPEASASFNASDVWRSMRRRTVGSVRLAPGLPSLSVTMPSSR
eukprot:1229921-Rhodomonas_salina.1